MNGIEPCMFVCIFDMLKHLLLRVDVFVD